MKKIEDTKDYLATAGFELLVYEDLLDNLLAQFNGIKLGTMDLDAW